MKLDIIIPVYNEKTWSFGLWINAKEPNNNWRNLYLKYIKLRINIIKKHHKVFFDRFSDTKLDLIFCDPPFNNTNINDLIKSIIAKNLLKKNGIIILHRHKNTKEKFTTYFKVIDKRIMDYQK